MPDWVGPGMWAFAGGALIVGVLAGIYLIVKLLRDDGVDLRAVQVRPTEEVHLSQFGDEVPVSLMRSGEHGYVVPWAVGVDRRRRFWLESSFPVSARPGGTVQTLVVRQGDSFLVWGDACALTDLGEVGNHWLPVTEFREASSASHPDELGTVAISTDDERKYDAAACRKEAPPLVGVPTDPDDLALLRLLKGAKFGDEGRIVLPSGRSITSQQARELTQDS
ncbi:Uncharacterised protein [Mycobacteroides abscessus subsp. abscessus]|uniref:hypothetical protein n=1 Tax=Mycobacteroides abscessus TaxID=36809 RepID=UPI0009A7C949|nr:hypothetical protein [Mycobacteroides abscessus]SLI19850.1 Uncharacterised protein [Mycobacteroides abscessus subsp. abscessus]